MSATFLALYRGSTIGTAELVAVTTDPKLIGEVASAMLTADAGDDPEDPAVSAVKDGRRRALQLVQDEARGDDDLIRR